MKRSVIAVLLLLAILVSGCTVDSREDMDDGVRVVPVIKQAELTTREKTLVSAVGSFKEVRVFSLENLEDYEWIETYIDIYDNEGFRPLTSTGGMINKNKTESF